MDNQNLVNEIRSKINIVDVISEYVSLTKKGQYYWGKCPFHNDRDPSMSVDEKRQTYTCWSCHNSGNVFHFVERINNIDFKEALKILGDRVGIAVSSGTNHFDSKYAKFYEIYEMTAKFYQLMLTTGSGEKAREYLKKRGIESETIKEFGIGLALDEKNKLGKYLKERKYDVNTLNNLGLMNGDSDTFIRRIVFPLEDRNGRIVGFSGRIYDNSKMSKYMNTKETEIFKKGNCLYHYYDSKEYVRTSKFVIVMEGFMDVIRASTIGIKNTVALMGTAMTEEQISLLRKLSSNVYLCLDGDSPGQEANLHNGALLEEAGFSVKVIVLKDDDDPDTFILKNGLEKFQALIDGALNYSDYKIERLRMGVNFSSDIELSRYVNDVILEVSSMEDEIRREIVLKKLASETNLSYNTLEKKLNEYMERKKKGVANPFVEDSSKKDSFRDKYTQASLEFLYYMLTNPKVIKIYDSKKLYFIDAKMRSLAGEISYYYHHYGDIVIADFYTYLDDKKELLVVFDEILKLSLEEEISDDVIFEYVKVIQDYHVKEEMNRLSSMMRKETDEMEKAKIAEKMRLLRIEE